LNVGDNPFLPGIAFSLEGSCPCSTFCNAVGGGLGWIGLSRERWRSDFGSDSCGKYLSSSASAGVEARATVKAKSLNLDRSFMIDPINRRPHKAADVGGTRCGHSGRSHAVRRRDSTLLSMAPNLDRGRLAAHFVPTPEACRQSRRSTPRFPSRSFLTLAKE
jgi:hypothetical protein